jgi:hypothetical protein
MVNQPDELIRDFLAAIAPRQVRVEHDSWPAPHKARKLPSGQCAVYVFSLSARYGAGVQAGADRALKVGKAGPNCNARFQSQHYSVRGAPSTLADKLVQTSVLWPYLGIKALNESDARGWIERNTDRHNFYLTATDEDLLGVLEIFLRGRLGPTFEG